MAETAVAGKRNRVERAARLKWVPIGKMRVSAQAQRELNDARVNLLAADFDLEQLGTPTVNYRDGWYWILDGQHRIEALRAIGWGDQQVQCWTYEDLTVEEEAEKFLKLNDTLTVNTYTKFRVAVRAGRVQETEIDRIVRAQNLRISQDKGNGAISAVGTLKRVHKAGGPAVLGRALRVIRDAYGDPGFRAPVIDGIGLLCQRYNGALDDELIVSRLSAAHGGVNGLLGKAEHLRKQMGNQQGTCVAAAAVDIYNSGRGGTKLPSWWKADAV